MLGNRHYTDMTEWMADEQDWGRVGGGTEGWDEWGSERGGGVGGGASGGGGEPRLCAW